MNGKDILGGARTLYHRDSHHLFIPQGDRMLTLDEMEKLMILEALERHNGNRTKAALSLGICIRTLRNKIHQLRAAKIDHWALKPSKFAPKSR